MPQLDTTRKVPVGALRFDAGKLAVTTADDKSNKHPVSLLARTVQPVDHWFWGRVVHDFSGMKSAASIPIDYCHDDDEIMGYIDQFTVGGDGLTTSGFLVGFKPDDMVAEVTSKAAAGVPYQASIYFDSDNAVIEEVPAGMAVQVNGGAFHGPGIVFRQWMLRGVAICPYGYDAGTEARFNQSRDGDVAVQFTKGTAMADNDRPSGQKFIEAFGTNGAVWFAEGKTFEQAQALHMGEMSKSNATLTEQVGKLTAELKTATDSAAKFEADAKTAAAKLATVEAELAKFKAAHGNLSEGKPVSGGDASGKPTGSAFAAAVRLNRNSQN